MITISAWLAAAVFVLTAVVIIQGLAITHLRKMIKAIAAEVDAVASSLGVRSMIMRDDDHGHQRRP